MTVSILGIGTALPARSIAQRDAESLARSISGTNGEHRRLFEALYRRSAVRRRASVLLEGDVEPRQRFFPPAADPDDRGPGTGDRQHEYELHAGPLALRAAAGALVDAAIDGKSITHLVTASCTGFHAPGVDVHLIGALGLRPDVVRTHVGFMGCHGAINALRVARAFSVADPDARVLVCAVELCSLHFHYGAQADQIVANALFADGAAAVVVARSPRNVHTWSLEATASFLIPDSLDAMTWRIGNSGFEMTLSPRVPGLIESHLAGWLDSWLHSQGLARTDVASWAIHPGGPRIIDAVTASLDLDATAVAASREVLADHGNMSSPTVLFILARLRAQGRTPPCAALAFGPGLVVEAALLR